VELLPRPDRTSARLVVRTPAWSNTVLYQGLPVNTPQKDIQAFTTYLLHLYHCMPMLPEPLIKGSSKRALVYRGIPLRSVAHRVQFQATYKLNETVQWKSITSVTTSQQVAQRFARQGKDTFDGWVGGVIFAIDSHSARMVDKYSVYPGEREALLMPGFKGKVTAFRWGGRHTDCRTSPGHWQSQLLYIDNQRGSVG
jgi:hypothetical protein